MRSKGLKNEIAGYITKYIKKEVREEKAKQARIAASKAEQQVEEQSEHCDVTIKVGEWVSSLLLWVVVLFEYTYFHIHSCSAFRKA